MPTIKINVDHEEMAAIQRRADAHGIKVPDLAYGALNCMMSHCMESYCIGRISQAIREKGGDLPAWSDSARSISAYEGQKDISGERGPHSAD